MRVLTLAYGIVAYLAFLGVILYAIGFVADAFVPRTVDRGPAAPAGTAIVIDLLLLSLFAVQHTVMARPAFKRRIAGVVPPAIERSTFVLAAAAVLALLFWQWRPLPAVVWEVESGAARALLFALQGVGWATVVGSSFLIDHFDLFGLRQVWAAFRGRPYAPPVFRVTALYGFVRHPLMLGFLIAFWSAPTMTRGHLLFSGLVTGYILFGTWIEERDLLRHHGGEFAAYRARVPAFLPWKGRAYPPESAAAPGPPGGRSTMR